MALILNYILCIFGGMFVGTALGSWAVIHDDKKYHHKY